MKIQASFAAFGIASLTAIASAQVPAGSVYTLSNDAGGNAVLAFDRSASGKLTPSGAFPTGGLGTGMGLGSQGAVILSPDGMRLFGVDAGSNEISVFDVVSGVLVQRSRTASGGIQPTSLTLRGDLLYVLNAGGSGNLVGFDVDAGGGLTMIQGSTRPLSGPATMPAQIQFGPGGQLVFVTERATNLIGSYFVEPNRQLSNFLTYPSSGMTPFGFAFGKHDVLIVSEAVGGTPNASSVSSYKIAGASSLPVISPSAPTTETAACWMVVTKDGKYAYTTNTGSGTVSGYFVGTNGALTLLDPNGVTAFTGADSKPIDEALSRDSRFLYVLSQAAGRVDGFRVRMDGSLGRVPGAHGLPTSSVGLAAR